MKKWSEYTLWQKLKIIFSLALGILFLVFAGQNGGAVQLKFIGWSFQANLFIALFASFIIEILLISIILIVRVRSLNKIIKTREDEIKQLKMDATIAKN